MKASDSDFADIQSFQAGSAGSELSAEVRFLVWTLTEVT